MGLNKCFANGQSQAQAIGWAEFRYPMEFIEDPAQVFPRHTDAPIGNQNLELVINDAAANLHRLVGWRKLEGIAEQVDEYMGNQSKVHGNKRQVRRDVEGNLSVTP
jgi:hypothetical protein